MKKKIFKLLVIVLMGLVAVLWIIHYIHIDGISYIITDRTSNFVAVTHRIHSTRASRKANKLKYRGVFTIPSSVNYKGKTYHVKSIGGKAFWDCDSLTSITIPNSVTSIGKKAFYDCDGLTSITIPESVTILGKKAFSFCSNLASITIPNSVTSIGKDAFEDCSSLKEVHITDLAAWCNIDFGDYNSNPLYYADNLYLNRTLVTGLVIPDGVTEIKDYTFEGCSNLTSVTIPNSVTSIGEEAFSGCSNITSITSHIPANKLFAISSYEFMGVNKSACTLYVPAGTKATYEATEGWKAFKNIVEGEAPGINGTCGENATW